MEESKFKIKMLVGKSAADREAFRGGAHDAPFEIIAFASPEDGAARERYARCLREKTSCVLDGAFAEPSGRAGIIREARDAGAWVVAFDFSRADVPPDRSKLSWDERRALRRRMREQDCFVTLAEGFDEIRHVRRIDGVLKHRLYEMRVPMTEFVRDGRGQTVEVRLGSEYYMIERTGCLGCLMSYAAFERCAGGAGVSPTDPGVA